MKAISLTQPWASLVAIGAKHWETRSWATWYRGEVAIRGALGFWTIPDAILQEIEETAVDVAHDDAVRAEARGEA